ncbi:hypothetical protein [Maribacter aquivivus]|uniref:hypothetical protein n=1 Tax=Maribacter aquivivus TaxID=228958 RepID=UPI002491983F|nr:hypothetical protein [Maribacter aquivivus]
MKAIRNDNLSYEEYLAINKETVSLLNSKEMDFFEFEFATNKDHFLQIFTFYHKVIKSLHYYKIFSAHLYIRNNFSINARATKIGENYFVGVNMGTLRWIVETFYLNEKLINNPICPNPNPYYLNVSFGTVAAMFTIYHEAGHLVQKSEFLKSGLYENNTNKEQFSIERHALEIDADMFAAQTVANHVFRNTKGTHGENYTTMQLENILIEFIIPFIIYLLSFEGNKQKIYFEENSHPHPAIRLHAFTLRLLSHTNNLIENTNRPQINSQRCISMASLEMSKLQNTFFNDNRYEIFQSETLSYTNEIIQYKSKIENLIINNPTRAVNKWYDLFNSFKKI